MRHRSTIFFLFGIVICASKVVTFSSPDMLNSAHLKSSFGYLRGNSTEVIVWINSVHSWAVRSFDWCTHSFVFHDNVMLPYLRRRISLHRLESVPVSFSRVKWSSIALDQSTNKNRCFVFLLSWKDSHTIRLLTPSASVSSFEYYSSSPIHRVSLWSIILC